MGRITDWVDLAGSTVKSLQARDANRLMSEEWPETVRALTADERQAIEQQRGAVRRSVHVSNAFVLGLAKRLAPERRLLFGLALISTLATMFRIVTEEKSVSLSVQLGILLPVLILGLLLALELIDKLKFRSELELARDLQKSLIPERLPEAPGLELAAFNRAANTVGGDLYDFVPLPDGRLAILFGDASGHGMAAGLLMAVAHASFRTQLEIDPEPPAIMNSLNRILLRAGGPRSFFTCCYLLVEPEGRFRAVVAGHPPMLHVRGAEQIEKIGRGAYPLGIRANREWTLEEGILGVGETLVLYSDGLVEARDLHGADYGYDRPEVILPRVAEGPADDILRAVLDDWHIFIGDRSVEDDVSVAVIRRPPGSS